MAADIVEVSLYIQNATLFTKLAITYGLCRAILFMSQISINTKTFQNSNSIESENLILIKLSLIISSQ